jgi:exosortase
VASDPGDLILVLSGSMLAPPALGGLVEAHRAGGADLTLVFNPSSGRGAALGGPAEIYLCRPEILRHIPHSGYSDIKEGLIPSILRAGGTIRPAVLDQPVGNFHRREGYLQALEVLFRNGAGAGLTLPAPERSGEMRVSTGSEVSLHPTVRLCGPVWLGDRAQLAEDTVVIGPAVIGPDVVVGAQSVVVRSALWADAHVGRRCEVRESIVDCGAVLPEGAQIVAQTVAPSRAGRTAERCFRKSQPPRLEHIAQCVESGWSRLVARLPAGAPRPGRWSACVLGSALLLATFLWSYWPTANDLLEEWLRSDEYSSGLLVPLLAVYVLWLRREDLRAAPIRPALGLGVGAFLLAQAVRAGGLDLYSFAERFSLVLSLAAVVLLVLGWRSLAKQAPVLLFLCLMLPWPHRIQGLITLPLQRWSTTSAVFCLEMVGYEIQQDGNQITIQGIPLFVAEACNGLRMITAFFVISGLVVLLVKRAWWEKLIVLASSLPIAFLCNTLRLTVTAIFYTILKTKAWEKWFHDMGGYAMMPLALALIVGELWLLARLTTPTLALEPVIVSRRRHTHLPDLQ